MRIGVVKLGGSAISDKSRPFSIRWGMLEGLAKALKRALLRGCVNGIVVVHGGGSYGHYVVSEHGGLSTPEAFTQTVFFMRELNQRIVEVLTLAGLNAFGLDTHALASCSEQGIKVRIEVVKRGLEMGLTPVVYGDAVICEGRDRWFTIASGDDLAWEIASLLRASRLVFVTSVPGVFVGGRVARSISLSRDIDRMDSISGSALDVTGGMRAKLVKGRGKVGLIGAVYVIGSEPSILCEALCTEPSVGTRVVE